MDRNLFTKALWAAKLARRVTPNAYLVGRALLRRASRAGACWPSLGTLGEDVGCSTRTAGRAVVQLRRVGLLSWESRRVRWNRRASNRYALAVPTVRQENVLESSPATMSVGSDLAGALVRLGNLLGGPLPDWLTASRASGTA